MSDKAEIQKVVTKLYGSDVKVQSVMFKCGGDECLVTTNKEEIRYLHGERTDDDFAKIIGPWDFDEHDAEEFSNKTDFYNGYGY